MVIEDLSTDLDAMSHRAENVDDCASHGALAAPGFSNPAQRLPFVEFQTYAINGLNFRDLARENAAHDGKAHAETLNFD